MGGNARCSAKLGEEIKRLEESGLHCSAELLVQGAEPTQDSSSAELPQGASVPVATAHWIGSRSVLAAENEGELLVQRLRKCWVIG